MRSPTYPKSSGVIPSGVTLPDPSPIGWGLKTNFPFMDCLVRLFSQLPASKLNFTSQTYNSSIREPEFSSYVYSCLDYSYRMDRGSWSWGESVCSCLEGVCDPIFYFDFVLFFFLAGQLQNNVLHFLIIDDYWDSQPLFNTEYKDTL